MGESSLLARLESASERGQVIAVLEDLGKYLPSCADSRVLNGLLDRLDDMQKMLTQTEMEERVWTIIGSADPLALSTALSDAVQRKIGMDTLTRLMDAHMSDCISAVLQKSVRVEDGGNEERLVELRGWCGEMVSVVDRLANRGVSGARLAAWREQHPRSIGRAMCAAVDCAVSLLSESRDADLRTAAALWAKARLAKSPSGYCVVSCVVRHCSMGGAIRSRVAERLFVGGVDDGVSTREREQLLSEVVLCARSADEMVAVLGHSLTHSALVYRVLCQRMLLQKPCPPLVPRILADYVDRVGGEAMVERVVREVLSVWVDAGWHSRASPPIVEHLGRTLVYFARKTCSPSFWRAMFPTVMQGVQWRMESSDVSTRQQGMVVAEAVSVWMVEEGGGEGAGAGGEEKKAERLEFDYQPDAFTEELRRIVSGAEEEQEEPVIAEEQEKEQEKEQEQSGGGMMEMRVRDEEEMDSDDELPAYALPEQEKRFQQMSLDPSAEPEKRVAPPAYIRDCLEWLDEKEKYERFDAALLSLEGLIRRQAVGWVESAERTVRKMLFIEDRFNTPRFEEIRRDIVAAALAVRPALAPPLLQVVYERNCAHSHRYLVLECVLRAARELSSAEKEKEEKRVEEEAARSVSGDWRSVVAARIESNTRRFSSARPSVVVERRRLHTCVGLFLLPMLNLSTIGEHLQLRARDSGLLCSILFTASEILQLARGAPSVLKMTSALLSVAEPVRWHDSPTVRAAALFAHYSVTLAVPTQVWLEAFPSEQVRGWLAYASRVCESETMGEVDRRLAAEWAREMVHRLRVEQ